MASLINQNGTSSADTLTYNKAGTYHAGAGSDTIKIEGGSGIVVYTDSGNNIVNVTGGSNHTVKVAANDADSEKQNGMEKLAINGANQVDAYLGSGKDEIILRYSDGRKISGALSQIHGGGWTDTFTVGNGAQRYQLYGDAGNDIFDITAGSNIVCWGGAANDTFNVTGGTGIKLRGGDSADVYNIKSGAQAVDMQLGYGNDVVNVEAGDKHTIKANLGINTINLNAGSNHVITADIDQAASKKAGKEVGYGVDKVFIDGANSVTANLGDGRDVVVLSNTQCSNIYTEGWSDTIRVQEGTQSCLVHAGAGDDDIEILGGSYNQIISGSGDNTIKVAGGQENKIIASGDGQDTIIIGGGENNEVFTGGGGDIITVTENSTVQGLSIHGGDAFTTYNIYSGKDVIVTAGDENDVFNISCDNGQFNAGSGINIINMTNGNGNRVESPGKANVTITGGTRNSLRCGSGSNNITLNEGYNNTVAAGSSGDSVTANNGTFLHLWAGEGNDIIDVNEGSNNNIHGENGKDLIVLNNTADAFAYGQAGQDTIVVSNSSKGYVHGGDDSDVFFLDGGDGNTIIGDEYGPDKTWAKDYLWINWDNLGQDNRWWYGNSNKVVEAGDRDTIIIYGDNISQKDFEIVIDAFCEVTLKAYGKSFKFDVDKSKTYVSNIKFQNYSDAKASKAYSHELDNIKYMTYGVRYQFTDEFGTGTYGSVDSAFRWASLPPIIKSNMGK